MKIVDVDHFKEWCVKEILHYNSVKPSQLVLKSFYQFKVEKPEGMVLQLFTWLRSVADQTLKDYKSKNPEK